MKSKRLVVFLIVLVFLTVLIVLNSTLFTLQTISINWLTTKNVLSNTKDHVIVSSVEKGDSIFLLKKDEIKSQLEKKHPYLRVVSIETKFPNKIVIHSAERECMYAIKIADDNYSLIDEVGKVLSTDETSAIFAGLELDSKPIEIIYSQAINPEQFDYGEMIKNEEMINFLKQISLSLRESNYIPITSKRNIKEIEITKMGDVIFKTRNGMRIVLTDGLNDTTNKFLLGLQWYNEYHQDGVISGDIIVEYDKFRGENKARYGMYDNTSN